MLIVNYKKNEQRNFYMPYIAMTRYSVRTNIMHFRVTKYLNNTYVVISQNEDNT